MMALLRFATLAPSGHNAQPWRFRLRDGGLCVIADFSRRTPVVDPDDHHLFVSLGCAAETFLIAAAAYGRPGVMRLGTAQDRIEIDLASAAPSDRDLCRAIPARQSTRSVFDGRAVPSPDLAALREAGKLDGVSIELVTGSARLDALLDFVIAANDLQLDDPAFVRELRHWVRFNRAGALRTGDGLFAGCTGNPAAPEWLGKLLFAWLLSKRGETGRYSEQVRSSAGVAVFIAEREDPQHWVQVGRSFMRFALRATALGIRHAHINQPAEVPAIRRDFARWLGIGSARPDLVVRYGYGSPMPMSLRRPVRDVLATAA